MCSLASVIANREEPKVKWDLYGPFQPHPLIRADARLCIVHPEARMKSGVSRPVVVQPRSLDLTY